MSRVHVIGAGLSGLAAALHIAEAGREVVLHEGGRQAGGRCRSYFDSKLGCRIDNGNHLLMACNTATLDYLTRIGARERLMRPTETCYPFLDLSNDERWDLRPNPGRFPWFLWSPDRRIPRTKPLHYLGALSLLIAGSTATVKSVFSQDSRLYRCLWQPLAMAALNTEPETGAAFLLRRVLAESFLRGGAACLPLVPCEGLSETLVDPALERLQNLGVEICFGSLLRRIEFDGTAAHSLHFDEGGVRLMAGDAVVLAVTAPVAARLVPGLAAPDEFRGILNAHYKITAPPDSPLFIGVIGGTAEWVFRKNEILSVTVSAADRLIDRPAEDLAALLWQDAARAYELPIDKLPAWQIVKERRATFAATPAQLARRPATRFGKANLYLAGDWTDTGLPATIEGAVRSGLAAAEALLKNTVSTKDLSPAPRAAMLAPLSTQQ